MIIRLCLHIVIRDLKLSVRQGYDALIVLAFFVITVALFPLGVGPETNTLSRIGPGVICVAALLSAMLSLDRLFQNDYEDGTLEQLLLSPLPLEGLVLSKVLAHWLLTGFPIILVSPLLGVFMYLPHEGFSTLIITMTLGTPISSLIGAVGAALTLGARRGGVLVSILILPLYIPLLIFSVSAVDAAIRAVSVTPNLLFLGAMLVAAIPLATWASAAALRQACD